MDPQIALKKFEQLFPSRNRGSFGFKFQRTITRHGVPTNKGWFHLVIEVLLVSSIRRRSFPRLLVSPIMTFQSRNRGSFEVQA